MSASEFSSKLKLLVIGLVLIINHTLGDEQCLAGPNEEFNSCGSACPKTCDNHWKDESCDLPCKAGCFCKRDYVRNPSSNLCVLTEDCPRKDANDDYQCYGQNKVYKACSPACPETCSNYLKPQSCPWACAPGCACKDGYVRDDLNHCVKPEECQRKAPECTKPYEEFQECGSGCPLTCENHGRFTLCQMPCAPGCFCIKGFVRDVNGNCVLPRNCPSIDTPPCGSLEVYRQCGSACPQTCQNYGTSVRCRRRCVPGCYCLRDYVRDENGSCILPQYCQKSYLKLDMHVRVCRYENEQLRMGTACEPTCQNFREPPECNGIDIKGCFCRPGFVRDKYNRCIHPRNCPRERVQCIGNLERRGRPGASRELTCDEPEEMQPPPVGRCPCLPGLVRDNHKECTEPEHCSVACPGLHETYDCGSPCDVTCAGPVQCDVFTVQCVNRCYCKSGFVRDHRGTCIAAPALRKT